MVDFSRTSIVKKARKILEPVKYELIPGGSGRGMSYYESYVECPKRTALRARKRLDRSAPKELVAGASGVGTIFHAYQDVYHQDPVDVHRGMFDVEFTGQPVEEEVIEKGFFLHQRYRDRFRQDFWGRVIHTERRFPESELDVERIVNAVMPGTVFAKPENIDVDAPPFTVQYDLTTLAGPQHVAAWKDEWDIVAEPGYYIIDWKSVNALRKHLTLEMLWKLQFVGYQVAFQAMFPNISLKGLIAVCVTRTKDPKIRPILIPFPNQRRQRALTDLFQTVERTITDSEMRIEARPGGGHCFSWGAPCEFLTSGECMQDSGGIG